MQIKKFHLQKTSCKRISCTEWNQLQHPLAHPLQATFPFLLCLLALIQYSWLSPHPCQEASGQGGREEDPGSSTSTKHQRVLAALTKSIYWQYICTNIYWSLRCLQMRQSCEELCREVAAMYPTPTPIHRGPSPSSWSYQNPTPCPVARAEQFCYTSLKPEVIYSYLTAHSGQSFPKHITIFRVEHSPLP